MALWRLFKPDETNPDDVRMTLGEHLEELRSRLIRCIVALVLGAVVCFLFIDYIEGFLTAALFDVLRKEGYSADMMYTGVAETFITDFQLALVVGFILTAPYILMQLWGFVAAGLYKNERRWVRRFVPFSIGLFFLGAAFFLVVVTPFFLKFFVSYKKDLPDMSRWIPTGIVASGTAPIAASQPASEWPLDYHPSPIPAFKTDPQNAPEGVPWLNETEHEIRIRYGTGTHTIAQLREVGRNRITPMITIQDYMIFVLEMAAAFGAGFQVPVVVALLATIGVFEAAQMARARRYIWFAIAVAAALITPSPDAATMMLLFVPMAALFEAGLIAARMIERERASQPA